MFGLMQDRPLLISSLIDHAATFHPNTEIVSRLPEGPVRRSSWAEIRQRAKQVANALKQLGVQPGERVGTLAWNSDRHLALYFGVSGAGAVLHTVNPRLFPEQIDYIINHAEDRVLFFDITFAPLVARLAPLLKTVKACVAMTDRAHMPAIDVPGLLCWDELVHAQRTDFTWPELDERSASSLCYTSGTTGNPKGVLYSHRSTMLHTLMELAVDTFGISSEETVMLIVPMFHANAWGTPYAAAMAGTKLVLPGPASGRRQRLHPDARRTRHLLAGCAHGVDDAVPARRCEPRAWTRRSWYSSAWASAARRCRARCSSASRPSSAPRSCRAGA
jgi:fatty-acyl-CoA synthase